MNGRSALLVSVLLVTACGRHNDPVARLDDAYDYLGIAYSALNEEWLRAVIEPNYRVVIGDRDASSFWEHIERSKRSMSKFTRFTIRYRPLRFRFVGDSARVETLWYQESEHREGSNLVVYPVRGFQEDLWVLSNGRWMLKETVALGKFAHLPLQTRPAKEGFKG